MPNKPEPLTPERVKYHELLPVFRDLVPASVRVYDVGKHRLHDYRPFFVANEFLTVDINPKSSPDILVNVESADVKDLPAAGALLCNGVTEICSNPFDLIRGCNWMLSPGGVALFGIQGPAYPSHTLQKSLFTPSGAINLLSQCGFEKLRIEVVQRGGVPSYSYLFAKKVREPHC
ncbi:MAG: hypothetical protein IT428_17215 [Planctomycetaceae bacterium]|nr:hypothetical protein [Planctomycetaceae bacterium]